MKNSTQTDKSLEGFFIEKAYFNQVRNYFFNMQMAMQMEMMSTQLNMTLQMDFLDQTIEDYMLRKQLISQELDQKLENQKKFYLFLYQQWLNYNKIVQYYDTVE